MDVFEKLLRLWQGLINVVISREAIGRVNRTTLFHLLGVFLENEAGKQEKSH